MKIIEPSYEILYPVTTQEWQREFKLIELAGRTAYKSEEKIDDYSFVSFIKQIKKRGHGAVLEFGNMIVKFVTDRGITHELVRHRLCSFIQESTRYCNYSQNKFGNELTFIKPSMYFNDGGCWEHAMNLAEEYYFEQINENNQTPQEARAILPNSLKTEIVVKANFREWMHIFDLRVLGKTGAPHPDMKKLMLPLYEYLVETSPFLWE